MKVEELNKNKNTITLVAFVLVCIVLNIESLAALFHFTVPQFIKTYGPYFPLLFVIVVFTQKKSHSIEVFDESLWEAKKKDALQANNTKMFVRYSIVVGIGVVFIIANMFESASGFSFQNGAILIGLLLGVIITFIYGYLKKGFHVGFCEKGILYGYTSKVMLINWEDISDFEINENKNTIIIYCKKKIALHKVILKNPEHFKSLKALVTEKLTYKNVTKLLTDD